tara:strand:+ start:222 stop:797 length:576 start_codon:yes stop_codon:yes gene_type:complete
MFDIVFFENPEKLDFKKVLEVNPIIAKNPKELRKKVSASKDELVIVIGGDDNLNLEAVSNKRVDILLDPDRDRKKDFKHHLDSGLNIQIAQLAKKNEVAIGFSFERLFDKIKRIKALARMTQNIRICRKYKLDAVLANFAFFEKKRRNLHALQSLARIIGMRTDEIKDSLSAIERIRIKKAKTISPVVSRP